MRVLAGATVAVVAMGALGACGSTAKSSATSVALGVPASYAHFSARFPSQPQVTTEPSSVGDFKLEIYFAAAGGSAGREVVGEEDIAPALPADQYDAALTAALKAVTSTSDLTIIAQPSKTTYRSHPAYRASYSEEGADYEGLSFVTNGRLYIFLTAAPYLPGLEQSFQATP